MKILMVSAEVTPLVKVGGVGDVVGSLPRELMLQGHSVRVVCPFYGCVNKSSQWIRFDRPFGVSLGEKDLEAYIWEVQLEDNGIEVLLIENKHLFGSSEVYEISSNDPMENARRFIFFSRAVINLCYYLGWVPDVVHCHDWPTALIPVIINTTECNKPMGSVASVLTIHSIEHQGIFPRDLIECARLPENTFRHECLAAHGQVNLLKGGIYNATKITTVSPKYAMEIQRREFGFGLEEIVRSRSNDLVGVTNGIDTDKWNPARDDLLPAIYDISNLKGKRVCKQYLQESFGLISDSEVMVVGIVSRLYWQKGLDLLLTVIPRLFQSIDVQFVILGQGDQGLEEQFSGLTAQYPGRMGFKSEFSNQLAHLVYAGSDIFAMPSRYEPCGLGQMYAMRYGTIPVARAVGGLVDTIEPYSRSAKSAQGFLFEKPDPNDLFEVLHSVFNIFRHRSAEFSRIQRNSMERDFSWKISASRYSQVFKSALDSKS
ncbi:MAG: Glycogen synthase [Candidatus Moanabacter tarae]|uniref:Glycogen synthase n=1 Tax=Candidatus Moanibacter tarae TaxID=2200854 RepID=A0A2Z4AEF1_9BACT|nr:MAG: Glycogen synthase [Candidatus Moanabacter tarae]|tara:strand:+ start:1110 stop:2567 length:1458 start_codon:yes stop_codon:yes gene_type:complete